MKRRLMALGLVTTLFFTSFSVLNMDPAYAAEDVAKKDRKYSDEEIDSTVKKRANQLIATFDGKYFTSDGKRAGGSSASDCGVVKILNKGKRVHNLNSNQKGGRRPSKNSYLPSFYHFDGKMYTPAYSCVGFAMYAQWYLFANWYNDDINVYRVINHHKFNYKNMKKYARVGDIIWTSGDLSMGHASVVLDVTRDGVKVIDSNTTMYSNSDYGDNRICVYTMEYGDQSRVTISRPVNYYIHYSDGLDSTSYEEESVRIPKQVVVPGERIKLQKKKFEREGYTYDKYYIYRVKDGKTQYLCKHKKTGDNVWITKGKISSKYKKRTVKVGGELRLASKRVKRGGEIRLKPVWKKIKTEPPKVEI